MAEIEWLDGVPSFTVGQFSEVVNEVLRQTFSDGVWVEGEIQGLKRPNPHLYFSLVENIDGAKAQLNINLFAGALRNVQAKLRNLGVELKEGMRVRLFGRPDYYAPFGKLSLTVTDVDTQFTAGDIAQKREALVRKLHENGTTRINKGKQVPLVPLRLGIISSSQAAGFADARKHLIDSGIGFSVTLCDVRVQGDDAVPMIVAGLRAFSRRDDIDVVLLMRGGGSKSDLAAFDDERIAMAIAACAHPVFTGIGHEIDQSVADLVAHTECKTPTACADEVIAHVREFLARLDDSAVRVRAATSTALERARGRVRMASERLSTRPRTALERERAAARSGGHDGARLEHHARSRRVDHQVDGGRRHGGPGHDARRGWFVQQHGRWRNVMATKKQAADTEPKGYAEAMAELEALLRDLDSSSVDVDVLSSKVTRASYLIEWCNDRITAAQVTVDELVAGLGDDDVEDEEDEDFDEDDE